MALRVHEILLLELLRERLTDSESGAIEAIELQTFLIDLAGRGAIGDWLKAAEVISHLVGEGYITTRFQQKYPGSEQFIHIGLGEKQWVDA